MIDEIAIIHKGGLVLWRHFFSSVKGNPINQLIKTVLLEDRAGETSCIHDTYKVQWLLENDFDLVFVVVYQHLLALNYIDNLLEGMKCAFIEKFQSQLTGRSFLMNPQNLLSEVDSFTPAFKELLKAVETLAEETRMKTRQKGISKKELTAADDASPTDPTPALEKKLTMGQKIAAKVAAKKEAKNAGLSRKASAKVPVAKKAPPKKVARAKWNADGTMGDQNAYHAPKEDELERGARVAPSEIVNPEADPTKLDDWKPKTRSRFTNFLRDRFGNREVDEEDLKSILPSLKEMMTSKNVAQEIAEKLCDSASAELQGKTIPNFTSLGATIRKSLEASLLRILTPKRDVNILRDISSAKERGRPYTIAFCGVNGVGKSTTLSKVAYWLKSNNLSVLIAACDTFRSGAVEQLQVHSERINVPVFQKGYAKDAAEVARDALIKARKEKDDVVLIDTAGRMQDNEPLMRSLAKLIHSNKPDLVLFVGEALVGNDGVDQLRKFNSSLQDFTPPGEPARGIDGLIVTKFDTIDDKMGAAISMVYQSGQPIVFVGVGQSYQDLRELNPQVVANALLD